MHSYQVDVEKRNRPLWTLAGIATVVAPILVHRVESFQLPPWAIKMIPAPSAFFIFLILYLVFNHLLWKTTLIRWMFSISEPDLSGEWKGKLKSNTQQKELNVTMTIKQTWSKIAISIPFEQSTSCSFSASILCHKSKPTLIYNYENVPHQRSSESMTRHIGTTELLLQATDTLSGTYFTSGDRKSEGSLYLQRS